MSLINDALKKAQKQRTGEAPSLGSMPSVGGESPQRIARRAKPAGGDTLIVRAGIGGAVVLVLAVGGFFLLRDKPREVSPGGPVSAPAVSGQVAQTPSPSPQPPITPPPAANNQQPVVSPPAFTLPVAPKTEPVAAKSEPPAVVANAEVPKSAPPTPAKSPAPQPATNHQQPAQVSAPPHKLEARAIEFIENIKVAGIRASATDAKVLMNDRVYRPGSMVSAEFGLKLVEITASSLTFEDDRGGRYTRTF